MIKSVWTNGKSPDIGNIEILHSSLQSPRVLRGLTANLAHRGEERETLGKQAEDLGQLGRRLTEGILGSLHLDKVTEAGGQTLVHGLVVRDVLGALADHQHQLKSIRHLSCHCDYIIEISNIHLIFLLSSSLEISDLFL